jgi:hypothetical protein
MCITIAAMLCKSCTVISFQNPMPPNEKALKKVPNALLGKYHIPNEEEVFHFYEEGISQTEEKLLWYYLKEDNSKFYRIDSVAKLVYFPNRENVNPDIGFAYEIKRDTLYTTVKEDQGVVEINKTLIIKKHENGFVFNIMREDDQHWMTFFLYQLSDGNLVIKIPEIFDDADVEDKAEMEEFLDQNREIKSYISVDSIVSVDELDAILPSIKKYDKSGKPEEIILNPNEEEFKKLVSEGFFSRFSMFEKIK